MKVTNDVVITGCVKNDYHKWKDEFSKTRKKVIWIYFEKCRNYTHPNTENDICTNDVIFRQIMIQHVSAYQIIIKVVSNTSIWA